MKKWQIAVVAAAVVAVAVAALFGGRAWGDSASSNDNMQPLVSNRAPGDGPVPGTPGDGAEQQSMPGTGRDGGKMLSGSIIAADDTSITIQTADGSTKIVLVSAATSVTKTAEGSLADLATGQDVVVTGTTNADNSVTATGIVLGSALGFGIAPGGAPPSGSAPAPGSPDLTDAATQ